MDELFCTPQFNMQSQESLSSGGEYSPRAGGSDGSNVRTTCGRSANGAPAFDQVVPHGGYLWWYVDGISDDGQHGITIIAFVGSVFSPYYLWANRTNYADPNHYCCLNVAIYSKGQKRWTMTERGRKYSSRDAHVFQIGPSQVEWRNDALEITINERAIPFGQKVAGKIKLYPEQLFHYSVPLDTQGKHRWGPIAPTSTISVDLQSPNIKWQGHAYLDSNEGDEPINRPFYEWDWARALLKNGNTAVMYDVREKNGAEKLLALNFQRDGKVTEFSLGERFKLPKTMWQIQRNLRSDHPDVKVIDNLEDTPFYSRSILSGKWLGEEVTCMHETLNIPRFSSPVVQLMLPWRMPRLA
jgi:carotenoid 1,2-hydratase